jgi:hypothetical protein
MESKKAFIKQDGTIGEKEHSCIEYVDNKYLDNIQKQKAYITDLLSNLTNNKLKKTDIVIPKTLQEMNRFKVEDPIKVKTGTIDTDDNIKTDISN